MTNTNAQAKVYVIEPKSALAPKIEVGSDKDINSYKVGDRVLVAPLIDRSRHGPITPAIVIGEAGPAGRMFLSMGADPYSFPAKQFETGHVMHIKEDNVPLGLNSLFEIIEREVILEGLVQRFSI